MREEFATAARGLEEILALEPSATAAHYPLGQAYLRLGEPERAQEHLRQREAAVISPADPLMAVLDGLLESAQAYETRGIEALVREDWDGAIAAFRRGLELDAADAELRHRLGTALYLRGDTVAGAGGVRAGRNGVAGSAAGALSLGVLLQEEGRHQAAAERFATALRGRSSYTEARLRLAYSLRRAGDPEGALAQYVQVSGTNPNLVEPPSGRAMTLVVLRRWGDARAGWRRRWRRIRMTWAWRTLLARLLAAAPDAAVRDGGRALVLVDRLASRGRTLELGETMAMALAEVGAHVRAAALQRDLVAGAARAGLADVSRRLQRNLRRYERGEACRVPWPDGGVP